MQPFNLLSGGDTLGVSRIFCHQGWTLYWSSAIAAQHSQNLYQNQGKGAIALYNSAAEQGTGIGLYLAGTATEAEPEQVPSILSRLFARAGDPPPDRTAADYLGESPRRVYQFQPHTVWITGDRVVVGKQLVDTKIQLDLDALIADVVSD